MPLQEFWYEDPNLLWIYRTCFVKEEIRKAELESDLINYQSWLTGMYVFHAIASAFGKNTKYPSKPFELRSRSKNKIDRAKELEQKIKSNLKHGQNILNQRRNDKE